MTRLQHLQAQLDQGLHRVGQIEIIKTCDLPVPLPHEASWLLCHENDAPLLRHSPTLPPALELHLGPSQAREISTLAADGAYRFTKGQTNLRCGWVMLLRNLIELDQGIEGFYPASLGLWTAFVNNELQVQNLRDKLDRQTGMYRFARNISDAGAQTLVQRVCGPAHQCAKKILWQIDSQTPLDDSEASRFNGISSGLPLGEAMPLLCREACNHFVAECRLASKREFEEKAAQPS